jgi:hypothetical protein
MLNQGSETYDPCNNSLSHNLGISKCKKGKHFLLLSNMYMGAGVTQSVQCLTTDRKTQVRSPAEAKDFPLASYVQTSFEAHPVLHHSEDKKKKDTTINREMKLGKHKRTGINK